MGRLSRFGLNDIIAKYQLHTFIETGTGLGDGLFYAAKHSFNHCYSFELNSTLYKKTSTIFNQDYISVIHSNSTDGLDALLPTLNPNPILFFLDAHFPSGPDFGLGDYTDCESDPANIPIIKELKIIHQHRPQKKDVIIIDDLRLFKEYPPNPLPNNIPMDLDVLPTCTQYFKSSHQFLEVSEDEGYLVLLPKIKTKSETEKVRPLIMPYIKHINTIADIGFGGDKIVPHAIGIDYETPHTHTGDDPVDIGCDVSKGIPIQDNTYDCVYSSHLLEDFTDTATILKEFIRILTPNGLLVCVVPNELVYRQYCKDHNHPYNTHHKIDNMDADYLESVLHTMGVSFTVLYKETLVIDYNSILIVKMNPWTNLN